MKYFLEGMSRRSLRFVFAVGGLFAITGCENASEVPEVASETEDRQAVVPSRVQAVDEAAVPPDIQFPRFTSGSTRYAGSDSCRECHSEVHAEYASHPMANSTIPVEDDSVSAVHSGIEFSAGFGRYYRVKRGLQGGSFHHERSLDGDDQEIYDHSVRVDLAMGSGANGKSYLYFSGDRLMQSPIAWYTGDGSWSLSPGYEGPANPQFERLVAHDCVACHIGLANPTDGERYSLQEKPIGEHMISCERCHGPSQEHVDFHSASSKSGETDPILSIEELTPAVRDAICLQCHLQGARRIPHPGADEFSFRPGMTMNEVWTVFMKSAVDSGDLSIVSHGEQMVTSRCYTESAAALGCITCHDPHTKPSESERIGWYRSRCLTCHSDGGEPDDLSVCAVLPEERRVKSPEDSCIACHMPSNPAADVAHTARTDHRIPRFSQAAQESTGDVRDGEDKERIFEEAGWTPDAAIRRRATGIYKAEAAFSAEDRALAVEAMNLLRPVVAALPDDVETFEAAGRAAQTMGNLRGAALHWERGLAASPRDEMLLLLTATLHHNSGEYAKAEEAYRKLTELNPRRSLYFGRLTHVLGMQSKWQEGIRTARKALELNPSLIQAHQWLGMVLQRNGDSLKSHYHSNMANRIRSSYEQFPPSR